MLICEPPSNTCLMLDLDFLCMRLLCFPCLVLGFCFFSYNVRTSGILGIFWECWDSYEYGRPSGSVLMEDLHTTQKTLPFLHL